MAVLSARVLPMLMSFMASFKMAVLVVGGGQEEGKLGAT